MGEATEFNKKLEAVKNNAEASKAELSKVLTESQDKVRKLETDVSSLESTAESLRLAVSSLNVKKISDELTHLQSAVADKERENKKLVEDFKVEFSKMKNGGDSVESKLESQRKNLTEMIRTCEKKSEENSAYQNSGGQPGEQNKNCQRQPRE